MTIFDEAVKAYHAYTPTLENQKQLDEMTDAHYELCGDIFTDGFKAGVAYILSVGKDNAKQ